jgi:hypothetical protein
VAAVKIEVEEQNQGAGILPLLPVWSSNSELDSSERTLSFSKVTTYLNTASLQKTTQRRMIDTI